MHLRGPMNVSQLAVYQLPSDMHTLQKRNTVPFYNRRRALKEHEAGPTKQYPHRDPQHGETGRASGNNVVRQAAADWNQVAYYTSAAPAEATGISFLANFGDPRQSGTFD